MGMNKLGLFLFMTILMMIWGFNVSAIKILVSSFPPITITAIRILVAGFFVFLMLGVIGKVRRPNRKEFQYIIYGGLFNITAHHFFLAHGLMETSGANGGLILGSGPVLTAILSAIIIKTMPSRMQIIGFIFGIIGVSFIVVIGNGGLSGFSFGDIYIFLSILSQAFSFILISKAAKTIDSRLLTGYMLVFGGIILAIIGLISEPLAFTNLLDAPSSLWILFLASAILATAIGQMGYNYAISKIGPAEAAIFLNLNTFFALVGSALFLGEQITIYHWVGLVFIIPGVLLGSGAIESLLRKRRTEKMKRPIKERNVANK